MFVVMNRYKLRFYEISCLDTQSTCANIRASPRRELADMGKFLFPGRFRIMDSFVEYSVIAMENECQCLAQASLTKRREHKAFNLSCMRHM